MEDLNLKFLGKDSGFGNKNNSAYIEVDDKLILIDCGFTVFEEAKKRFDFNKYKTIEIILTHLHNDHAGSLSQVILYSWFKFNKKVYVYSKCKKIQEYLDITGTPKDAYELKDESKNLEFIKTEHTMYLDAYGFTLEINGKKIVYTGDTNKLESFDAYLDKCDEFYVDVSKNGGAHLKFDDIIDRLLALRNNGIKICLMHLDDKEYIEEKNNNNFYI